MSSLTGENKKRKHDKGRKIEAEEEDEEDEDEDEEGEDEEDEIDEEEDDDKGEGEEYDDEAEDADGSDKENENKNTNKNTDEVFDENELKRLVPLTAAEERGFQINRLSQIPRKDGNGFIIPYIHSGKWRIAIDKSNYMLARLVALQFVPNPKGLSDVIHRDKNKLNCAASNLF